MHVLARRDRAPRGTDHLAVAPDGLARGDGRYGRLLRQGWMNQWLEELFREIHPRATVEEIENDIKQKPQEASARYLAPKVRAFIELAHEAFSHAD